MPSRDSTNMIWYELARLRYCMVLTLRSFIFFLISLSVFNGISQGPGCTQLSSPADGASNISVTTIFEWELADRVTEYVLIAGTSFGGTDILNNIFVGNVTQYKLAEDLPPGQVIYVAIITINNAGANGSCNQIQFTTQPSDGLPSCAVPISPEHAAQGISLTPNLIWQPVDDADGYLLTVGTTSGDPPLLNRVDVGNVTSFIASNLAQNSTYYFSVVPYNSIGTAENCGVQSSFTTREAIEETTLPCTELLTPENSTATSGVKVDLNWRAIIGAEGYLISVGTDSDSGEFLNRLDVGNVNTFEIPEELPPATKINVLIIPYKNTFEAKDCSLFSFTTSESDMDISNILVPRFFTPNNDGVNDKWSVSSQTGSEVRSVSVFNRYGTLLVQLSPLQEWDGSLNGNILPSGSYWYSVTVANSSLVLKGYFLLKR